MNIKRIAIIVVAALLVAISVFGIAVFLNDAGTSEASGNNISNTNTYSNTIGVDGTNNTIDTENNVISGDINNNVDTEQNLNNNENNTNSLNATGENNTQSLAQGSMQEEPEATTIENERVVSETKKLSWSEINLSGISADFSNKYIYVTPEITKYLVEHYKQTKEGTYSTKPNDIDRMSGIANTEATYSPKNYEGFEYVENLTTPADKTIKSDGSLVIKLYYKDKSLEDLTYTVNYLEKGNENNKLHDSKIVENVAIGTVIESSSEIIEIDGYYYDSVDKDTLTIKYDNNVINIYYTKRTDLSYTVKYFYNGVEDTADGVSYTVNNKTFGDKVTSYIDKSDRNGGNWILDSESTTTMPLIITTGDNIINVYYIKPDIIVEKSAPAIANAGDVIDYEITITNNGLLTDVVDAIDTLPSGVIVDETTLGDGIYNAQDRTIVWKNLIIANGSPVKINFKAKIAENEIGSTLVNNVVLSNGAEASATTKVNEVKTDVYEVIVGDNTRDKVNIVLTIDISSTMSYRDVDEKGSTRLDAAKVAAVEFVNTLYASELNRDATISLVTFDAESNIVLSAKDYNGKAEILRAINSLTNGYGTNIYDGLVSSEEVINDPLKIRYPENKNVIVFLGDGAPYGGGSQNTSSGIIAKAREMKNDGTTIYTVGFGPDATTVSTNVDTGYYILKNMASDGKFYTALTGIELANVFTNIASEINKSTEKTSNLGVVTIPTTKEFIVNREYPIIVKYKDVELFRCTSKDELKNYYISYSAKELVWDINAWNTVATNRKVITNEIEIVYYIPRD